MLGHFDLEKMDYIKNKVNEQVEALSMVVNIVPNKEGHKMHSHVVVGKHDCTAHGGHLLEASLRPAFKVIVVETPNYLRRWYNDEYKLH
jgi:uncharacterized protein